MGWAESTAVIQVELENIAASILSLYGLSYGADLGEISNPEKELGNIGEQR